MDEKPLMNFYLNMYLLEKRTLFDDVYSNFSHRNNISFGLVFFSIELRVGTGEVNIVYLATIIF